MVICLQQGANDLHMVQLMACYCHAIISCFIKIQIGLIYPGCCGKMAIKRVFVVAIIHFGGHIRNFWFVWKKITWTS